MQDTKVKDYLIKEIPEDKIDPDKDLHLSETYELCVNELTDQQAKRDQIIAFYIAIVGFVIPTILGLEVSNLLKSFGYILLYAIGVASAFVVIRYRVYKEVYWISCRVIQKLYNFDDNKIDKALILKLFYQTTVKNASSVICVDKDNKLDLWQSFWKKIRNSAETMLFELMVFIPAVSLLIGVAMMSHELLAMAGVVQKIGDGWCYVISVLISLVPTLYSVYYWNMQFCKKITDVYKIIFDHDDDKAFNAAFHKAWFLHFYID